MKTEPTLNGTAQTPEQHASACWQRLVDHAKAGRCTCHYDACGNSVHVRVLRGCVTGRMLYEEYSIARRRVVQGWPDDLPGSQTLEAGDMGSTLESSDGFDPLQGCSDGWKSKRAHLYGPDGKLKPGVKP